MYCTVHGGRTMKSDRIMQLEMSRLMITQTTTGPAAKVRPVRPWPYQFLRENKWRCLDSNLRVRYRVASPRSSP